MTRLDLLQSLMALDPPDLGDADAVTRFVGERINLIHALQELPDGLWTAEERALAERVIEHDRALAQAAIAAQRCLEAEFDQRRRTRTAHSTYTQLAYALAPAGE